jgi:integrator complex subunit 11
MSVQYMSFSAHADAKGIMQLISYCEPRHVMLVHGEAHKMTFLKEKIREEHGIECFMPANGETACVPTPTVISATVASGLVKEEAEAFNQGSGKFGQKL